MDFARRGALAAVTALVLVVAGSPAAWADSLQAIDGDIVAGGADISVTSCASDHTFSGQAQLGFNGSNNGAHWAAGATVTVTATAPAGSGLTASGGSGTIPSDWGPSGKVLVNLTTGVPRTTANGTYTVTVTAAGNKSGGGTLSATSGFTVNVSCTTPAPVVAVTGVTDGSSYDYNTVPAAGCLVGGVSTPSALTLSAITGPRSAAGLGSQTATCSATNAGGTTTVSRSYSIVDLTPPVVTVTAPGVTEATGGTGALVNWTASAFDSKDGSRSVTCTPSSGSTFVIGTTHVSCSATDLSSNTGVSAFDVVVSDTHAPVLVVPDSVTVEAASASGALASYDAGASDIVDGAVTPSCSPASGSQFPLGTTSVTCVASDAHSNSTQRTFDVNVVDTTAPTLTLPTPITVEAASATGATVTFTATASDSVDSAPTVSCDKGSGATFALGVTTVHCTATDDATNQSSGSFTVTVQDTTAPTLSTVTSKVVEATKPTGADVIYAAPTANDLVDGVVLVACDPSSGATFPLGQTTVSCTATDNAGNTGSTGFAVTVRDTTAPAVEITGQLTEEATGPSGAAVNFLASVTDAVSTALTAVCRDDVTDSEVSPGDTFPLGTTHITCSATDGAGNTGSNSAAIAVVDTTAPHVTVPGNAVIEATGPSGAAHSFSASASDIVDGTVATTCSPTSGSTFPLGPTTVTCSAKDDHGNEGSDTFTVTVVDTTGPSLSLPADITAEATSAAGRDITYTASANDDVDGAITPVCSPDSGSTFAITTTTVHCTATDAHSNPTGGSFTVTVEDTTAPVVTVPADITAEATSAAGRVVTYTASGSDLVDGDVAPDCDHASGSAFPLGVTTVSCTASDARDNTSNPVTFTITVQDTTKPTLSLPGSITVEATGASGAVVTFTATAADTVDASVVPDCTPASGSTFALGVTTVSCSATDDSGNTRTGSFSVSVVDTTAPTLTTPGNLSTSATGLSGAVVGYSATASDLVDGVVTPSCAPASGSLFAPGTTQVTCSATDTRGNTSAPKKFTVTVSFDFAGFYQPVDMGTATLPVYNTVKGGSTVPLKFELFAGSTELTSTSAVKTTTYRSIPCSGSAQADDIEMTATGGTVLRYDSTSGQFVYNWQTPKTPGACLAATVTAADGTARTALFKLK
jgi:hypothetical protein